MKCVAIIPARGGSKAIPRKNVLPLSGKPLIAWMIEAARNAKLVDSVVVSTDDAEIAAVSERFGAAVAWRPAEISGDLVPSEAAVLHALNTQLSNPEDLPELTAFLQCTAPLTDSSDIDGTIEALLAQNADTALAVADFHYYLWKSDENDDFAGINHDKSIRKMRQEREPNFVETGSVYVMKTDGFLRHKHRFFGKTAFHVIPHERVLEIDDLVDFKIAQTLIHERQKQNRKAVLPERIALLIFDFDGVFTDDTMTVNEQGTESITCSRADGLGIELAHGAGISMLIISKETNPVVKRRAEKLKLDVLHGVNNKADFLDDYLSKRDIAWADVVYVGNDVNDIECLNRAGCGAVVANAHPQALASANLVLDRCGGNHAVRELIELILHKNR